MIRHEQNLRLNVLISLFNKLELKDFDSWIIKHPLTSEHFDDEQVKSETIASSLEELIQHRNDASHGEIINLPNHSNLLEYCDFYLYLIEVARQFITKNIIERRLEKQQVMSLGKITETFKNNGACVLTAEKDSSLSKGDDLFILHHSSCTSNRIESIMLDDKACDVADISEDGIEVGLKFQTPVPKNSMIFKTFTN